MTTATDEAVIVPLAAASSLDAVGVAAWFGTTKVLADVTIAAPPAAVTALIGPSGCGKSTFLRVLNRMHESVPGARMAGEVYLDGEEIYAPRYPLTQARRQIGMVFQKPNPFPAMSIAENVVGRAHPDRDPDRPIGPPKSGRALPPARRPLGGSQGPAQQTRRRALRWPAAAAVHRPGARGRAEGPPHGRTVLGSRPDVDAPH